MCFQYIWIITSLIRGIQGNQVTRGHLGTIKGHWFCSDRCNRTKLGVMELPIKLSVHAPTQLRKEV